MTTAIAIWGAVTGTIATLAQLLGFWRDRPRFTVSISCGIRVNELPRLTIEAANRGRQPTTLVKVAFVVAYGDYAISRPDGDERVGIPAPEFDLLREGMALVEPGGVARFQLELDRWPPMVPADVPLRAYVLDSHGRRSWGPAAPLLRMLLNSGWKPPRGTDQRLLDPPPDGEPLPARPVYPSWQVWRPRGLRTETVAQGPFGLPKPIRGTEPDQNG